MKQPLRIHIAVKLADGKMLIEKEKVSKYVNISKYVEIRVKWIIQGYKKSTILTVE